MQFNVTFSEEAEYDIFSAYLWYEEQRDGLGDEFKEAVRDASICIQANPLFYSYRFKNIRGCQTKRFPYLLLYFVDGSDIRIISVFHTKRNYSS